MKYTSQEIFGLVFLTIIGLVVCGFRHGAWFLIGLTAYNYLFVESYTFWEAIRASALYAYIAGVLYGIGEVFVEGNIKEKLDQAVTKARNKVKANNKN